MPFYKADYFFNAQHVPGWTETFYLSAGDTASALLLATRGINDYIGKRRAILHAAYNLQEIRVSDVAVNRDSLVTLLTAAEGQGLFGDKATAFEQAWDGMLLRGESGALTRRGVHIRGIPAGQVDTIGTLTLNGPWINVLTTWRIALTQGNIGFLIRKQTPTPVAQPITCTILGDNRSIRLAWAVARPVGVTEGTFMNVKKVQDANNVNGRWRVQYVDATTATMFPKRTKMYGNASTGIAAVETVAITYVPFTNVIPVRGVKLNTGKSSDAQRGRRTRAAA